MKYPLQSGNPINTSIDAFDSYSPFYISESEIALGTWTEIITVSLLTNRPCCIAGVSNIPPLYLAHWVHWHTTGSLEDGAGGLGMACCGIWGLLTLLVLAIGSKFGLLLLDRSCYQKPPASRPTAA